MTRRTFVRRASGLLLATATGGVLAARPDRARAAPHNANCGAQFGPLHRHLWATSPDPFFADTVIWRESRWTPDAFNRSSEAAGLAQFLPSTFSWGCIRFDMWGDVFDPYFNMDLMSRFLAEGEYAHWACGPDDC